MHRALWLVVCVLAFFIAARESDAGRSDEIRIAHPERANPEEDCRRAVRKRDLRFVGVYGFILNVPGVTERDEHWTKTHGIKVIAGTGDAGDTVFNDRAEAYAERYNACLLAHLARKRTKRSNHAMQRTASRCAARLN